MDRIGFGFLAMDVAAVVTALGEPLYPLFETVSLPDGGFIGEDALFCDRLRRAGLPIYVDHLLSYAIGHIAEQVWKFSEP